MNPQFRTVALLAAILGLLVSLFFALNSDDGGQAAPGAITIRIGVPVDQIKPQ